MRRRNRDVGVLDSNAPSQQGLKDGERYVPWEIKSTLQKFCLVFLRYSRMFAL